MTNSNDEQTNEEQRSPKITRATLGRVVAVLIFVALGTFAVIYSMKGKTDSSDPESNVAGKTESDNENAATTKQPSAENLSLQSKPAAKKTVFKNDATQKQKTNLTATKLKPQPFTPVQPTTTTPKTVDNSFGATSKPNSNPPGDRYASNSPPMTFNSPPPRVAQKPLTQDTNGTSQSFGDAPKSFSPPKSFEPPTTFAAKSPATPPPASQQFDKLKNPFGGSGGGFVPNRPVAAKLGDQAKKTIDQAKNLAGNLKQNAAQKVNGLFNSPKPPIANTTDQIRNLLSTKPAEKPPAATVPNTNRNLPTNSPFANQSPNLSNPPSGFPSNTVNPTLPAPPLPNTTRSVTVDKSSDLPPLRNNPPANTGFSSFGSNPTTSLGAPPARQPVMQKTAAPMGPPPPTSRFESAKAAPTTANSEPLATPGDRLLEGAQAPALTIEKLSPKQIQLNTPFESYIVVRNTGRVAAKNVQVFDKVPAGSQLVSAAPQPNQTQGNLRWDLDTLRPGQEKRIKIRLNPTQPGEIGSVAHVTFATPASTRTLVTKPVLEIRHSIQPKILIGDSAILDIIVENKGDGPAENVMIQEDVPTQLEYQEGFREIEYEIGTLAPGQSKRIRLALRAGKIGQGENLLFASANGDLRASHKTNFEVIAPKLIAEVDGPSRKYLQRESVHKFAVKNHGTAKATNVDLIAKLPSGLRYISANNQGKYDQNTHSVYWSLAELPPSISATVELKTLPIETGNQPITFEARSDLAQHTELKKDLLVEHLIDVFFDIDDVVDPIEIGSGTSYQLRVINQGTKTATNVQLQIAFPNGIRPTKVDGNLQHQIRVNQVVFAPITSMNPGDELKLTVHAEGVTAGDHRVAVTLQADGRQANVSKEETTRVYNDR